MIRLYEVGFCMLQGQYGASALCPLFRESKLWPKSGGLYAHVCHKCRFFLPEIKFVAETESELIPTRPSATTVQGFGKSRFGTHYMPITVREEK